MHLTRTSWIHWAHLHSNRVGLRAHRHFIVPTVLRKYLNRSLPVPINVGTCLRACLTSLLDPQEARNRPYCVNHQTTEDQFKLNRSTLSLDGIPVILSFAKTQKPLRSGKEEVNCRGSTGGASSSKKCPCKPEPVPTRLQRKCTPRPTRHPNSSTSHPAGVK